MNPTTTTGLTPEQRAELEKVIRDSIPNDESRELKFGCEMKNGSIVVHAPWMGEADVVSLVDDEVSLDRMAWSSSTEQKADILGRPLTLFDILFFLQGKEPFASDVIGRWKYPDCLHDQEDVVWEILKESIAP